MKNLWSIFFLLKTEMKRTNPEMKKNNQSRYNKFPRNCCHLLSLRLSFASTLFRYLLALAPVFCNGGQLYHFFLWGRGRKSGKETKENAGDSREAGTDVWSKSYRRLLSVIELMFSKCFRGECM